MCPGETVRMREDTERQFVQAAQEQNKLEEKLVQVERKALLTLNNTEQIHREQLEAERRLKVHKDPRPSLRVTLLCPRADQVCLWLTGAAVCGADGAEGAGGGAAAQTV